MSQPPARRFVPRGVYTMLLWAPGLALAVSLIASPAPAQTRPTITPAMTKGAAGAPVTIVEFSDYQ